MDITGFGSIASFAESLINKIFPPSADPNEKLRAQVELQKAMEARENSVIDAQKAVIVAEMQQSDNFTKRARPSVVYCGLIFIFLNHVFLPSLAFFRNVPAPTFSLPPEFWWAWTGVVGVWMVGRTMEKRGLSSDIVRKITGGK